MLNKRREGFTLIELLIVIVIIGILAAIAIPKFGATREKAYEKAVMSDLRNLQSQQELYYSSPASNYSYANNANLLPDFQTSTGVEITGMGVSATGWWATAGHQAMPDAFECGIAVGDEELLTEVPAHALGIVTCTDAEGNPPPAPAEP